jgi:surface polysaccharide O-acyltransferase-like enzyme
MASLVSGSNRKIQDRLVSVDIIKIISIFLVILGPHLAGSFFYKWDIVPRTSWIIAIIYDSPSFICVPLFVMISGSLLLTKQEPVSIFFKKRFVKVVIPFFVWVVIYLAFRMFYDGESHSIISWIGIMINGPTYYHLWFLYMLIGLYAITPLLRVFLDKANQKELIYLLSLWLILVSVIPSIIFLTRKSLGITLPFPYGTIGTGYLWLIFNFVGYYLFGGCLEKLNFSKMKRAAIWFWFILGVLSTMAIMYFADGWAGDLLSATYGFLFITIVIESVSAYLLLKHYLNNNENKSESKA